MSLNHAAEKNTEETALKNGNPPAVVWDYDRVLSDGPAYRRLVEGWYEADHLDDDTYDAFDSVNRSDYRNDQEFEGDLLYRVTDGLEGQSKGELFATTADLVVQHRDEFLSSDAHDILHRLERHGFENHIISHNYRILFDALADHSPIDENNVHANRLEVGEDGRLTGRLAANTYRVGKRRIVADIANQQYVRAGIGDSVADIPLLRAAEDAFATNPTDELREEAEDSAHIQTAEDLGTVAEHLLE
ncbi:MAG: haloacid dehalogenase-like hydrolase [Candidatus Nanohaloarchaea archaeon]|nr:haloacid dehalogenase-like hydrolase [Candidatus Nanohaloarchaea archaeon]